MSANKSKLPRGAKDSFGSFFEDPSRETLQQYLDDHLGEGREIDFKQEWLSRHDLARMILGFANTRNAALIFGVKENSDHSFDAVGLEQVKDKADFQKELKDLLPGPLLESVELWDLPYKNSGFEKLEGKTFQVVLVPYMPERIPFLPKRGTTDLKPTAIYIRRDGETVEANHEELESLINRRIETKHSTSMEMDLRKHLEQLKVLHEQLPRESSLFRMTQLAFFLSGHDGDNGETYAQFLKRMIRLKQMVISRELAIPKDIYESDNALQRALTSVKQPQVAKKVP